MPAKRFREQHVWVLGTSFIFPLFASVFVASKPIKDTKLSFIFNNQRKREKKTKKKERNKKIRKDNPNQLLINEINALQTEQSN